MTNKNILITGASGQLGSVLTERLQEKYGADHVIASDLRVNPNFQGRFVGLDATDFESLKKIIQEYEIDEIYHLAAILSASGEKFPLETWDINMNTFFNVLESSRLNNVKKIFFPSSIAVFGQGAAKVDTPQSAPLFPSTVYGISKAASENWINYYHKRYGMDIRSLRYPGIIGYQSLPGGGTTDYAVDIFHKAVKEAPYKCFLKASTILPMIYMNDAIRATMELMDADAKKIHIRTSYNLAGMSFSPEQVASAIQKKYPQFEVNYEPDFRQQIAENWPMSIDDSAAKRDWNWKPEYNLESTTETMITHLKTKYETELVHN